MGSHFTNTLLRDLPPTLHELSLTGACSFKVPCVFPPPAQLPLTWLLLEGAQFTQNHLAGLPEGLLYLQIDVAWGCEGGFNGMGFKFATFDCTSLPSTLTTLVFNADRAPPLPPPTITAQGTFHTITAQGTLIYTNDERPRGPIELVGTLPPNLQQLVLAPEQHVDVQPSLLPEGCTLRRSQDIDSDESGFLSSDSTD
ncbi:hypothetical protein B484DRAFT_452300 [Ochromonadaceae sp. CCMP2298]|nr:hypothetical protein B484DRAFT_452300 [Ochromonadaceae sp. CCMP2298]|mmetsp:Transcript_22030/g.48973  ORF Transcript_22030/g.48973 Transcript_22030/m.48973 type:complete len:198 (-) Transcript_22030:188-781(-)